MSTYSPAPLRLLRDESGVTSHAGKPVVILTKPAPVRPRPERDAGPDAAGPRRASGKRSTNARQTLDFRHLAGVGPIGMHVAANLNRPQIDAQWDKVFRAVTAGGGASAEKPDTVGRSWDAAFRRATAAPKQAGSTAAGWDQAFAKAAGRCD